MHIITKDRVIDPAMNAQIETAFHICEWNFSVEKLIQRKLLHKYIELGKAWQEL